MDNITVETTGYLYNDNGAGDGAEYEVDLIVNFDLIEGEPMTWDSPGYGPEIEIVEIKLLEPVWFAGTLHESWNQELRDALDMDALDGNLWDEANRLYEGIRR